METPKIILDDRIAVKNMFILQSNPNNLIYEFKPCLFIYVYLPLDTIQDFDAVAGASW